MQSRRSLRLVAGALVLAVPLLGSCGFDQATDKVYTPAAGINDRAGDVDVLSAVIVSAQPGSGTFLASLSNNLSDQDFTLTGVAGAGDWSDLTVSPSELSIDITARGFVNLADEDPITVDGDLTPGQVAELTLTFDSGDTVTMDVPVVYACNAYEGLDSSGSSASEPASPTTSPSPGDVPTDGTTVSPTASPTSSESPSESASSGSAAAQESYDCVAVGEG
jgi:hypothetical protein